MHAAHVGGNFHKGCCYTKPRGQMDEKYFWDEEREIEKIFKGEKGIGSVRKGGRGCEGKLNSLVGKMSQLGIRILKKKGK